MINITFKSESEKLFQEGKIIFDRLKLDLLEIFVKSKDALEKFKSADENEKTTGNKTGYPLARFYALSVMLKLQQEPADIKLFFQESIKVFNKVYLNGAKVDVDVINIIVSVCDKCVNQFDDKDKVDICDFVLRVIALSESPMQFNRDCNRFREIRCRFFLRLHKDAEEFGEPKKYVALLQEYEIVIQYLKQITESAVELDKMRYDAFYQAGCLMLLSRRIDEAVASFKEGMSVNKYIPEINKGKVLVAQTVLRCEKIDEYDNTEKLLAVDDGKDAAILIMLGFIRLKKILLSKPSAWNQKIVEDIFSSLNLISDNLQTNSNLQLFIDNLPFAKFLKANDPKNDPNTLLYKKMELILGEVVKYFGSLATLSDSEYENIDSNKKDFVVLMQNKDYFTGLMVCEKDRKLVQGSLDEMLQVISIKRQLLHLFYRRALFISRKCLAEVREAGEAKDKLVVIDEEGLTQFAKKLPNKHPLGKVIKQYFSIETDSGESDIIDSVPPAQAPSIHDEIKSDIAQSDPGSESESEGEGEKEGEKALTVGGSSFGTEYTMGVNDRRLRIEQSTRHLNDSDVSQVVLNHMQIIDDYFALAKESVMRDGVNSKYVDIFLRLALKHQQLVLSEYQKYKTNPMKIKSLLGDILSAHRRHKDFLLMVNDNELVSKSIDALLIALEICQNDNSGTNVEQGEINYQLGKLYIKQKNFANASECFGKSIGFLAEQKDKQRQLLLQKSKFHRACCLVACAGNTNISDAIKLFSELLSQRSPWLRKDELRFWKCFCELKLQVPSIDNASVEQLSAEIEALEKSVKIAKTRLAEEKEKFEKLNAGYRKSDRESSVDAPSDIKIDYSFISLSDSDINAVEDKLRNLFVQFNIGKMQAWRCCYYRDFMKTASVDIQGFFAEVVKSYQISLSEFESKVQEFNNYINDRDSIFATINDPQFVKVFNNLYRNYFEFKQNIQYFKELLIVNLRLAILRSLHANATLALIAGDFEKIPQLFVDVEKLQLDAEFKLLSSHIKKNKVAGEILSRVRKLDLSKQFCQALETVAAGQDVSTIKVEAFKFFTLQGFAHNVKGENLEQALLMNEKALACEFKSDELVCRFDLLKQRLDFLSVSLKMRSDSLSRLEKKLPLTTRIIYKRRKASEQLVLLHRDIISRSSEAIELNEKSKLNNDVKQFEALRIESMKYLNEHESIRELTKSDFTNELFQHHSLFHAIQLVVSNNYSKAFSIFQEITPFVLFWKSEIQKKFYLHFGQAEFKSNNLKDACKWFKYADNVFYFARAKFVCYVADGASIINSLECQDQVLRKADAILLQIFDSKIKSKIGSIELIGDEIMFEVAKDFKKYILLCVGIHKHRLKEFKEIFDAVKQNSNYSASMQRQLYLAMLRCFESYFYVMRTHSLICAIFGEYPLANNISILQKKHLEQFNAKCLIEKPQVIIKKIKGHDKGFVAEASVIRQNISKIGKSPNWSWLKISALDRQAKMSIAECFQFFDSGKEMFNKAVAVFEINLDNNFLGIDGADVGMLNEVFSKSVSESAVPAPSSYLSITQTMSNSVVDSSSQSSNEILLEAPKQEQQTKTEEKPDENSYKPESLVIDSSSDDLDPPPDASELKLSAKKARGEKVKGTEVKPVDGVIGQSDETDERVAISSSSLQSVKLRKTVKEDRPKNSGSQTGHDAFFSRLAKDVSRSKHDSDSDEDANSDDGYESATDW